ncbi:hypothetical protein XELAEV_18015198mg [Xenopus laevis]|uniref:Endonuclease/exonuclease/phosphatase domain-containing protein n=1 Tax=Xenopus laevis TaxID=8355 RepID=A0A974DHJ4_XENLA|nr:hypothetical protein XELAEV_18015198mg [Xenopus laevis]
MGHNILLTLWSQNVNEINIPKKRAEILNNCHRHGTKMDVPFSLIDSKVDSGGHYVMLKATSYNVLESTHLLNEFAEGILLVGGDLNVALNPILDCSSQKSTIKYKTIEKINTCFNQLNLVDIWRTHNPKQKDYTFYSSPRNSYLRFD